MPSSPPSRKFRRPAVAVPALLGCATLLGCAVLLGSVVAVAGPAQAHNALVSSTPEAGSILTALPPEFSVTTNEDMLDTGDSVSAFVLQVVGDDGLYYGDGCVAVDGPTMSSAAALGPAGEYTLAWRVVSIDSHPVDGQFTFEWDPADETEITAGSSTPPECGVESAPAEEPAQEAAPGTEPGPDATVPASADPEQTSSTAPNPLPIVGIVAVAAAAIGGTVFAVRRRSTG